MLGLAGEAFVSATTASDDIIIKRLAEDQDRLQFRFPVFSPTLNSNFSLVNHILGVYRAQSTMEFYTMCESDKAGSSYRKCMIDSISACDAN